MGKVRTGLWHGLVVGKQRVRINGKKSPWGSVTGGVAQGSMLGLLLFIINTNDLDTGISSDVSKFANDIKIGRENQSGRYTGGLQDELDLLCDGAGKWQMESIIRKCCVGRNNLSHYYSLKAAASQ